MADRHSPNTPDRVRGEVIRRRVAEMRMAGHTFAEIGQELGISKQAASRQLAKALQLHRTETEEQITRLRAMEAERIETLTRALWPDAAAGRLGAVDRVLRLRESYRKLLGLDVERRATDDEIKTFVIDLRLPGHEDVVDGEITETDVTPQIGGG